MQMEKGSRIEKERESGPSSPKKEMFCDIARMRIIDPASAQIDGYCRINVQNINDGIKRCQEPTDETRKKC